MDNEVTKQVRFHHATGTDQIDGFHNESHKNIDERLAAFPKSGGSFDIARGIVEDAASQ